jgi:hypothetical protein
MKKLTLVAAAATVAAGLILWWPTLEQTAPARPEAGKASSTITARSPVERPSNPGDRKEATVSAPRTSIAEGSGLGIEVAATSHGLPVPDVALELQWFAGAGSSGAPAAAHALRTDHQGRAVWRGPAAAAVRTANVVTTTPDRLGFCTPAVVAPDDRHIEIPMSVVRLDCEVAGTVRDREGKPIAGATVSRNGGAGTTTGEDGAYVLRVGTGIDARPVVAWADGYAQSLHNLVLPEGTTRHALDFVLPRGGRIAGRVLDAARAPVPGATVRASGALAAATTDDEGRFALTSLAPGSRHRVAASLDGRGRGSAHAVAGAEDVEVVLQRGLSLSVIVRGPDGRPAPYAAIAHTSPPSSGLRVAGYTDASGRCQMEALEAGPCELRVKRRGFATWIGKVEIAPKMPELQIALEQGKRVRGQVVDQDGRPLSGVSVYANLERDVGARTVTDSIDTDAEGRFVLADLPSEPCTVRAFHPDYQLGSAPIAGAADVEVVIRLAAGASVSGRVLDARTRAPVRDFTVRVTSGAASPALRGSYERHRAEDGRWRFTAIGLSVGTAVDVEVRADGYAPARNQQRAAPSDDPDQHPLYLQPGAAIAGRVRDARTGAALSDVAVEVLASDDAPASRLATDSDGRFELRELGPEPVRLVLRKAGYPTALHGPFEVGAGPGTEELELRLSLGSAVRGRIEGFPGDGWRLWAETIGLRDGWPKVAVAADGSFTLPSLTVGPHRLHLARESELGVARAWTLAVPDHDVDGIVLRSAEGGGTLELTVRGADKGEVRVTPLASANGMLGPADHRREFTAGPVRVEGLPEGPCRVHVTSGRESATREVEVRGTTRIEMAVGR